MEERLAEPEQHQIGLCLYYKCICDIRQNNKPKSSEDLKYLSMDYQNTEIKCKVLNFKSSYIVYPSFSFLEVISLPDSGAGNMPSTPRGTQVCC